ncbi:MAG TPA: hypothetical protein VFZ61_13395 [Polyangiales bacterium]
MVSALLGAGCARTPAPVRHTPDLDRTVSWLHSYDEGAQRLARFGSLHDTVRQLLIASGTQADWVRHGAVSLPVDSCLRAVDVYEESVRECSLVAVDAGTAVMIVSESSTCERWSCLEHSWAFLSDLPGALPLPPRRASDYGSLRADLSREVAEALWVAGYRGRSDPRVVDNDDPYGEDSEQYAAELADFSIASYRSCKLAPDGVELVCRSQSGGAIGLNPRTSERRSIASLAGERQRGALVDPGGPRERVWWTEQGELALTVPMQRHALCGAEPCTLLGLLPWPAREGAAPRFVRAD